MVCTCPEEGQWQDENKTRTEKINGCSEVEHAEGWCNRAWQRQGQIEVDDPLC